MKYDAPAAGEWIWPIRRGHKLRCCDCGLVHKLDFRIRKGHIEFRAFKDERATAASRRWARWRAAR